LAEKSNEFVAAMESDFQKAFESNYGKEIGAKLLVQYRMVEPIGNLVSDIFYDGELVTGQRKFPDIYTEGPLIIRSAITWFDTSLKGKEAFHSEDQGVSIYNKLEAELIIQSLQEIEKDIKFCESLGRLIKEGEQAIGVICMYREQKRYLRQKFNEHTWRDSFRDLVKIDTVDSYQGKENRIVIVSVVRNCVSGSPGFLRQPNRINVAMSRAMDRLIIVGATQMWNGTNSDLPLGKVVSYMKERQGEDYRFISAPKATQLNGGGK